MSEKPSRNEEEYFARQEAERIQKLRDASDRERVAAERKSRLDAEADRAFQRRQEKSAGSG